MENQNEELKKERKNTDRSLVAERVKASESLRATNEKTKAQSDQILKIERAHTDEKLNDTPEDKKEVQNERRVADQATEVERESTNKIISDVLDHERKLTDKNLSRERDSTDSQFEETSTSLRSEKDDHSRTKTTLTSREELLAIVSHDLRNPVGVAMSYATLILEIKGLDDQVKHFASTIKRNSESALKLINDLMDMERYAQNKWEFEITDCSAEQLIEQTIEDFRLGYENKKIELRSSLPSPLEIFKSDQDRLMQVLSNLLSNALKFTPSGGSITLAARKVHDSIQFSISDDGPGIEASEQKDIFKRFAQLKTKNRTGLGLGLHISKTLIEALGGEIWVESKVGKGSTFFFTLPTAKAGTPVH